MALAADALDPAAVRARGGGVTWASADRQAASEAAWAALWGPQAADDAQEAATSANGAE